MIRSGTVSVKAGRFYVSVLVEIPDINIDNNSNEGIGIDLGLKRFCHCFKWKDIQEHQQIGRIKET